MKVWRLSFCFLLFQISQEKMGGFVVKFESWEGIESGRWKHILGTTGPSQHQRHLMGYCVTTFASPATSPTTKTTTGTARATRRTTTTTTTSTTQSLNFKRTILGPVWFKSPSVNYLPTKWCCFCALGLVKSRGAWPHILLQEENPENGFCLYEFKSGSLYDLVRDSQRNNLVGFLPESSILLLMFSIFHCFAREKPCWVSNPPDTDIDSADIE